MVPLLRRAHAEVKRGEHDRRSMLLLPEEICALAEEGLVLVVRLVHGVRLEPLGKIVAMLCEESGALELLDKVAPLLRDAIRLKILLQDNPNHVAEAHILDCV
eukprot:CAMPEP_0180317922 /NCGR_PEP_ID=MMETSP0988-20121125/34118_1 /TAXON_ID=697907 /ORGANISM="non described non described, Strain CCMP2293" /LENGTH=102 /DNA_ID=CAMNT_0022303255 /DNA_START=133 /DNA_END=437 /DNA_ORIENTATION=-